MIFSEVKTYSRRDRPKRGSRTVGEPRHFEPSDFSLPARTSSLSFRLRAVARFAKIAGQKVREGPRRPLAGAGGPSCCGIVIAAFPYAVEQGGSSMRLTIFLDIAEVDALRDSMLQQSSVGEALE